MLDAADVGLGGGSICSVSLSTTSQSESSSGSLGVSRALLLLLNSFRDKPVPVLENPGALVDDVGIINELALLLKGAIEETLVTEPGEPGCDIVSIFLRCLEDNVASVFRGESERCLLCLLDSAWILSIRPRICDGSGSVPSSLPMSCRDSVDSFVTGAGVSSSKAGVSWRKRDASGRWIGGSSAALGPMEYEGEDIASSNVGGGSSGMSFDRKYRERRVMVSVQGRKTYLARCCMHFEAG